ncbi:Bromodomain containing protein [Trichomonas vaginalis G3]|uniref:Bromodomain containing protein n=1 Tax=Trichomonas vaginalis (strain ATCC PRA-98 / G3) TaxID=412133 RepID=A2DJD7_TRIV3|nr:acetylation-dependent protein binding [Trichomonas vaginalis G3]EAY19524.1 Bromodomain containing protein [Trichomonas vaginalis G3]KAI5519994.1 acetylation-dependent protein binding [Trichomonas vaginalis G3]|eukprot:XP_001580510.1 Bromodomain containing protein [Trichomonas vaginalis G3]
MFSRPIDPEKDGAPDYYEVIKNPQDLGTIRQKLLDRKYTRMEDWISDIRLVWSNSIQYNGELSFIADIARFLSKIFIKQLLEIGHANVSEWSQAVTDYYDKITKQLTNSPEILAKYYSKYDFTKKSSSSDLKDLADNGLFSSSSEILHVLQILALSGVNIDSQKDDLSIDLTQLPESAIDGISNYIKDLKRKKKPGK